VTFLQELSLPALLLAFAVVPALAEELLFRGAFLGLLRNSLGPIARCVVVGATFGLLHLSIYRVFPTGAFGVLLCFAAVRSRSLWVPVIMHALHNGVLLTWSTRGDATELPAFGLLALSAAVAVGAVAGLGRR
jgi:membrane protease YdiL (CAAX protease family)